MKLGSAIKSLMQFFAIEETTDRVTAIQQVIDPEEQYTLHDGLWDPTTDTAWKSWVSKNREQLKSLGATSGLDGVRADELIKSIVGLQGESVLDKVHDLVVNKIDPSLSDEEKKEDQGIFSNIGDKVQDAMSKILDVEEEVEEKMESMSEEARVIAQVYPKAAHFAEKIVSVAREIGAKPYDLANLINFESGGTFSSSIRNSLGYTGLIQFGKSAAADLDTTTSDLANMSEEEQMDYVKAYLELPHKRRNADYNDPAAMHMAVFYPAAINKSTGEVNLSFQFPEKVVRANKGLKTPRDYMERLERNAKIKPNQTITESMIRMIIREKIAKSLM